MNCTQAQEVLSEAADGELVSAELLEEARAHCRDCAECSRFARGLALIQGAETPVPPARLHDRVMAALMRMLWRCKGTPLPMAHEQAPVSSRPRQALWCRPVARQSARPRPRPLRLRGRWQTRPASDGSRTHGRSPRGSARRPCCLWPSASRQSWGFAALPLPAAKPPDRAPPSPTAAPRTRRAVGHPPAPVNSERRNQGPSE